MIKRVAAVHGDAVPEAASRPWGYRGGAAGQAWGRPLASTAADRRDMLRSFLVNVLPALVIRGYRLIPTRMRRAWSFRSSTSHRALAAVQAGGGWPALASFARLARAPAGQQGFLGVVWVADGKKGSP
jgi:hypothetical protein